MFYRTEEIKNLSSNQLTALINKISRHSNSLIGHTKENDLFLLLLLERSRRENNNKALS